MQKLLNRSQIRHIREPADCVILLPHNDPVRVRRFFPIMLCHYAWRRGERAYCLILYSNAL